MNFEAMPQMSAEKEREESKEMSSLNRFKILAGRITSSEMRKHVNLMLTGIVAIVAVEGYTAKSVEAADLSGDMQEMIDVIKKENESETKQFFENLAVKIGVDDERMSPILTYKNSYEDGSGKNGGAHTEVEGEIAKSGDDLCFAEHTSVDTIELQGNEKAELWSNLASDARSFSLNGVEIKASGDVIGFEATSYSEDDAIISALADAVEMQNGVMVGSEKRLENLVETADVAVSNYEEKFVSEISSERYGVIDHYEVKSVEKNASGMYKVSVDVVFGEIVK